MTAIPAPNSGQVIWGGPTAPQGQLPTDHVSLVRGLAGVLDGLGLAGSLAASRRLLARADELAQANTDEQQGAHKRQAAAISDLVAASGPVDVAALTERLAGVAPWLVTDGAGQHPGPAVWAVAAAARTARSHASAMLAAEAPGVYGQLQKLAAEAVAEVTGLDRPPDEVWHSPDPASVMVRADRGGDWAVLLRTAHKYDEIHRAARVLRSTGGLGPDGLPPPGSSEPSCWELRNWQAALPVLHELRRVPGVLRVRYCADRNWEPGLWRTSDLNRPAAPDRRRFVPSWVGR